jgi:integrase
LTTSTLRGRFNDAREAAGIVKNDFQFRDLRAKAGTDKTDSSSDIRQAQKQLDHSSATMTKHYIKKRHGEFSKLTK